MVNIISSSGLVEVLDRVLAHTVPGEEFPEGMGQDVGDVLGAGRRRPLQVHRGLSPLKRLRHGQGLQGEITISLYYCDDDDT